ncbi:MAG: acetyl-CoA decarbonylase/synthase complex subunit delta [Dehalococcoidales bacterium]|nr:acetyl-CoA decarbonylase/synthase complex subunit delta [Dehalococcoidales bacterium]
MPFQIPKTVYSGKINEVRIGRGTKALTVGGETAYPFYLFEGTMPHPPRIAMEVYDVPPEDWPEAVLEPFRDVVHDAVAWAQKCVHDYKAESICLQLASTDPNGMNRPANEAAQVAKKLADAVDIPLIVWGTGNPEKDTDVLRAVAEMCPERNIVLGPVEEASHKKIGAAAIGFKHTVAASSPVDVNLAKQLNILLGNLGVRDDQILIDPTVSGIGYGIEYCFSVMERIRMAALTQQDTKLQYPIIANLAREVWKTKEARLPDDPRLGNARGRGILLEAMSAMILLLAGADIVVMRHPEAIRLVKEMVNELTAG